MFTFIRINMFYIKYGIKIQINIFEINLEKHNKLYYDWTNLKI